MSNKQPLNFKEFLVEHNIDPELVPQVVKDRQSGHADHLALFASIRPISWFIVTIPTLGFNGKGPAYLSYVNKHWSTEVTTAMLTGVDIVSGFDTPKYSIKGLYNLPEN